MAEGDPTQPPDPSGGWACSIQGLQGAIIVPHDKPEKILRCGVFTSSGSHVPHAATWRRNEPVTVPPGHVPPITGCLEGEWLWAGVLYHHFGHFITESLARLWAVPGLRDRLKGVVFVDKYPRGRPGFAAELLRHLIGDLPVHFLDETTQVEHLHVPGQGFGLGRMSKGTPAFRQFIRKNLASSIEPRGPEKLFITRSQLPPDRDGFPGEAIFDNRFARAGYSVFSPENNDIATQIARYKAARQIVGLDGSALHLFGFVARADQNVGVITRRQKGRSRPMRMQIEAFSGRSPHVIDALAENHQSTDGKATDIRDFDMEFIGRKLKKAGLIDTRFDWGPLSAEELAYVSDRQDTSSR